jgi:quinol monooxygenase YgiN
MSQRAVYFIVHLTIKPGKLDAFKEIAEEMIAVTRKEPGALAYEWYLSGDRSRCRILETYADEGAVSAHITGRAVQELVPKLLEVSTIGGFEVYGNPGSKAAETLKAIGAELFQRWHGLAND